MEPLAVLVILVLALVLATPGVLRGHANDLWAYPVREALILVFISCFVSLRHRFRAPLQPPARVRPRRLSEAKSEADEPNPPEQNAPPEATSEDAVADSNPCEEDVSAISPIRQDDPTGNPIKQDVLPMSPSEPCDTDGHALEQEIPDSLLPENNAANSDVSKEEAPSTSTSKMDVLATNNPLEQDIQSTSPSGHGDADNASVEQDVPDKAHSTELNDPKAEIARKMGLILDQHAVVLGEIQKRLIRDGAVWIRYSDIALSSPLDALRRYNLFGEGKSAEASLMLKTLQGPMKHTPATSPIFKKTNTLLFDLVQANNVFAEGIDRGVVHHPSAVKTALKVNASALRTMRDVVSDGDSSARSKVDGLLEMVDLNNTLILQQGTLIGNILATLAHFIKKLHEGIDNLVMTATADHLIALTNVPYGWETIEANNGPAEYNQEPGRRRQGPLTGVLRSNATAPADIVENVYELSRVFRGEAKVVKPMSEAVVRGMPHAEEMKRLLKTQEDLEQQLVRIERMQKDCESPRADHEATVKDQESQMTAISGLYRLIRHREDINLN